MKYPLAVHYVASNLWAIDPGKLTELVSVLAFRAAGHAYTPEEIKARIGDGGGSQEATRAKGGAVAVIPIRGVIAHRMSAMDDSSGGTSAEGVGKMLRSAMADASVGTILLDIDSPGGTVTGVSELAAELFAMRGQGKKIVAQVNGMAASAAYWLAAQADEIVSLPSGVAGSIGVFMAHKEMSKALEQEGINVTLISAGKFKVEGNPFQPLTEEAKAVMQAEVDAAYGQFVKDVARGRGVSVADVRNGYGEGRALTAKDAKAAGLIDRIATMDETIGRLVGRKAPAGMRALYEAAHSALASNGLADHIITPERLAAMEAEAAVDADRAARLRLL